MNKLIFCACLLLLLSCNKKSVRNSPREIDQLAEAYVRLALVIGQYDASFVDAYYGPDSLKPTTPPARVFPKDSLLIAVQSLKAEVDKIFKADSTSVQVRVKRRGKSSPQPW